MLLTSARDPRVINRYTILVCAVSLIQFGPKLPSPLAPNVQLRARKSNIEIGPKASACALLASSTHEAYRGAISRVSQRLSLGLWVGRVVGTRCKVGMV